MSDDRNLLTSAGTASSLRLKLVRGVFELKGVPVFEGLSAEDLLPIAEAVTRVEVMQGDALAREGDEAQVVWVLLEGRVEARRRGALLAQYEAGHLPGDLALVEGRHPSDLVVAERAALLELRRDDLEELMDLNPDLARNVMLCLSNRLRLLD